MKLPRVRPNVSTAVGLALLLLPKVALVLRSLSPKLPLSCGSFCSHCPPIAWGSPVTMATFFKGKELAEPGPRPGLTCTVGKALLT